MVAHCSRLSTTMVPAAISAGSISTLSSLSAPTAAMKVPAAMSSRRRRGAREGVHVTQISLSGATSAADAAGRTSRASWADASSANRRATAASVSTA
jgi:hypothetical protein